MHKYERLEKIYYRKKFLKIFFIIFIILLGIIFIFVLNNKNKHDKNKNENNKKEIFTSKEKNISKKNKEKNKTKVEVNFTKQSVIKSTNDKNFTEHKILKKENKTKNKDINESNLTLLTFTFIMPKIDLNNTPKTVKKVSNLKIKKMKKKSHKISLIIEENINIEDLIKSFHDNPSFDLAIQISEYYLNRNYLDLAKKWALKANSINPNRYESWKIFAIILLKRNEKEKAKEVLKTYLDDYGQNEEIEKLLRSINE